MTPGIHLFDKPIGPTSFSLVRACIDAAWEETPNRRPRICHGGTLDPFAQGLLLILAGPGVKLFDHLHAIPKVYEGTVRWGIETDNGDPLGKAISTGDASGLSAGRLEEALATFVGWQEQTPPATSAKRVDGERAYLKAHRGETVVMPPSRVYLHEASWLAHDLPKESRLRIVVRGGYYVRAMVRDLGRLAGCGAHLTSLHRTAIGPWNDPGAGASRALSTGELLPWAPSRVLSDQEATDLRQDKAILAGDLIAPQWAPPPGFPDPTPPVRGLRSGRLAFLLRAQDDGLVRAVDLGAGI
jgi:tRNA pseudouridine55 synthase